MIDKYTGRKLVSPADKLFVPPSWARIGRRHTFSDWLELLWITVRPVRRTPLQVEELDRVSLSKQDLDIIERRHHAIWFGRTGKRYLRAELRRRAVKALYRLVVEHIRSWKVDRSGDHHANKRAE